MSWKKALLIPRIVRLERRAPKDLSTRWNAYWGSVRETGAQGDVLWDSGSSREARFYLDQLREHADKDLPLVDVGCGNGRFTRILGQAFPHALGVDLSDNAVARAVEESRGMTGLDFRAVDMTAPAADRRLAAELGEANVFVRGVLHVLAPSARRMLARNLRDLLGVRGTLLLAETHFRGSSLDYLEHLGATPTHLPKPLERVLAAGLPRPSHFGEAELADCFPATEWTPLASGPITIDAVPTREADRPEPIPGYFAVLRSRDNSP